MIEEDGYIRVIDYGLATVISDDLEFVQSANQEYNPPEMISQAGYDKNIDWWCLGILIFEMIFGTTPFKR